MSATSKATIARHRREKLGRHRRFIESLDALADYCRTTAVNLRKIEWPRRPVPP
jgi:hypothetical protein